MVDNKTFWKIVKRGFTIAILLFIVAGVLSLGFIYAALNLV